MPLRRRAITSRSDALRSTGSAFRSRDSRRARPLDPVESAIRKCHNGRGAALTAPGPAQEVSAPMHRDSIRPRPRGTGSLLLHTDASGSNSWYGKWRVDGRQVMRKLGEARKPGTRQGLTRGQAETLLASARAASSATPASREGIDMAEAGRRFLAHKQTLGLKRSTLDGLRVLHPRPPRPLLRPDPARADRPRAGRGVHGRQTRGGEGDQVGAELHRRPARDLRPGRPPRLVQPQPGRRRRQAAQQPHRPGHPLPHERGARGAARRDARPTSSARPSG